MMQQPNPMTATGIGAIARGMPQGMPQPKPQPAGIALSSIDQIANTQGTKTVPDGLKPLLALEEALSKVKAAQNQQALQQQIPQGTIQDQMTAQAEQTLQQARGQSPQQAAPQVAAASQQQEQQKQAAMQRLMSGVAQAPGAQQVRMAGGGIVAFQDGGLTTGYDRDYMDARRFGIDLSPYDKPEVRAEKLERVKKMREFEQYMKENRAEIPREEPPVSPDTPEAEQNRLLSRFPAPIMGAPAIDQAELDRVKGMTEQGPQFDIRQPPSAQLLANLQQQAGQVGPSERAGLQQQIEKMRGQLPQPRPSGAAPGQVAPEQPGGVATLGAQVMKREATGQGISPGQEGPQMPDIEAIRRARQEEASKVYGPSEEETKIYEEQMARLRQEAQPKDQRWYERLGALAPYLASQRIDPSRGGIAGGLGRIAMAGQQMGAAEQSEREKRQARIDALQKQRLDQLRSGRTAGFEAGIGAEKAAQEAAGKREEREISRSQISSAEQRTKDQIASAERIARMQLDKKTDQDKLLDIIQNNPELAAKYAQFKNNPKVIDELSILKARQEMYLKRLEDLTLPAEEKQRIGGELRKIEQRYAVLAGGGAASAPSAQIPPSVGTVMQGYRFKGGDPSDKKNWEKV